MTDKAFLAELSQMTPRPSDVAGISFTDLGIFLLQGDNGYLFYRNSNGVFSLGLDKGKYTLYSIDVRSGEVTRLRDVSSNVKFEGKGIYWLKKK